MLFHHLLSFPDLQRESRGGLEGALDQPRGIQVPEVQPSLLPAFYARPRGVKSVDHVVNVMKLLLATAQRQTV